MGIGVTIDTLTQEELSKTLAGRDDRARRDAIGFRIMDFPLMQGTIAAGAITLGGDQPDQVLAGPKQGFVWAVHRVSVLGLAAADTVQLFKGSNRFIANIGGATAYATFTKGAFTLAPGDFIRVTGSGLSATGQLKVYSEGFNVPAPMMIKLS